MKQIFVVAFLAFLLSACSGDESTTINIEAPANDGGGSGGGDSSGGDSGSDAAKTCPEGTSEVSEGLCELPCHDLCRYDTFLWFELFDV